jgi:cellulose synthase (UDP-forming)
LSKKDKRKKKYFLVITIVINVVYLFWRIIFTLPQDSIIGLIIGITLILAEIMGFFQSVVFRLLFWKPYKLKERFISEYKELPSVDIFIATYNESESVLKKTIASAVNISYPDNLKKVYLCDDGRRGNLRKLCEKFNINYLDREDNKHAKAGNINSAISKTTGDFFVILDADMIAKEDFLAKTLPYFLDDKVGFVQTPQVFYNPDPFQYNLHFNENISNEQDFFMRDIQQGRSRFNATLHVGTNAVFRRSSIEEIGGIPTGTITEDMATGMLLQSKGYKGIFLNKVLALGLSVEKFSHLVQQRERWCRGNIQVSKKWNPLTMKGLDFYQRLIYVDGVVYWFFGVQKLIYLLCPLIYLIFGTTILSAKPIDLALIFIPSYIASVLTFRNLVKGNRTLTWSHIYEVAMAPYLGLASLMEFVFARPIPFKVTPKGVQEDKVSFSWEIAIPHIVLFVITLIALSVSVYKFIENPGYINSLLINLVWTVYNLSGITMSILVCVERPRFRATERFSLDDEVVVKLSEVYGTECNLEDISPEGLSMVCKREDITFENKGRELNLIMNGFDKPIKGNIAWIQESENRVGIKFAEMDLDIQKKLIGYLFNNYDGYYDKSKDDVSLYDSIKSVVKSLKGSK